MSMSFLNLLVLLCNTVIFSSNGRLLEQMPQCRNERTDPCRLKISTGYKNEIPLSGDVTKIELCRCPNGLVCGKDLENKTQAHSVDVDFPPFVTKYEMKFCGKKSDLGKCKSNNESALLITHNLRFFTRHVSYNCRCPGRLPLVMKTIKHDNYEHYNEHFVCAEQQPMCNRGHQCTNRSSDFTEFLCRCPTRCSTASPPAVQLCQ